MRAQLTGPQAIRQRTSSYLGESCAYTVGSKALWMHNLLVRGSPRCQLCVLAVQDSTGVYAAREFVWWYNGHPDQKDLPIDLSKVESVAVCGIGNVALDCARVLLRPVEQLATTDIAQHALEQLRHSKVKTVQLCARRGPVQVGYKRKTWGRCA
jgi:hypothetical protein